MQKLHIVGLTTDHEGLILSARRGTRSGGYLLTIDEAVEAAVDDLRARRADDNADRAEVEGAARPSRVESTLPVREIQARLRQGRSIAEVAKAAGVDPDWVDRFAPPIFAERAQVVSKVRAVPLRRARLGPSVAPIGDAVRHHLADRGVALTPDEFTDAWTARQVAEGRWAVRFGFHYRGRNNVLQFDFDEASGEVVAADRLSGQLGYVAPPSTSTSSDASRRQAKPAPPVRPTVKRPVVSTGFRPDEAPVKAVSRPAKERERAAAAMRKGAAQRALEVERAAARRARERTAEAARSARENKAAVARAAREQRQQERMTAEKAKVAAGKAKKVAAKKAAAEKTKAAAAKKVAAKKVATEKAKVAAGKARAAAAKKVAAEKARAAAAKKVATKKVAAERAKVAAGKAKKVAAKKAPRGRRATPKATAQKLSAGKTPSQSPVPDRPAAAKQITEVPGVRVAAQPTPAKTIGRAATSTPTTPTTTLPAARAGIVSSPTMATSATAPRATRLITSSPVAPRQAIPSRAIPNRTIPDRAGSPTATPTDGLPALRSIRADEPVVATPAVARPMFRPGFVEQAAEALVEGGQSVGRPVESSSDGLDAKPQRPRPDRPRRTQPLRAT